MDKTILLNLKGHPRSFRLEEPAYERLSAYLARAAAGLAERDRAEVLGDLELSVADKVEALLGPDDRIVTAADIDGVLARIGAIEAAAPDRATSATVAPKPRRKLERIRDGQQLTGVCNGLAAYAQVGVDWVRTFFILGTLVTAGILGLVYIALIFLMPVAAEERA